jgi:hypothetical protein
MEFILRLRAWQVFSIIFIPVILADFDSKLATIWYSMFEVIYTFWIYAIGIKMNSMIPGKIRRSVTLFKVYNLLYIFLIISMNIMRAVSEWTPFDSDRDIYFSMGFILLILYLSFNIWMFAARMLESVIEGTIVNRSDSLKAFLCFWFFPIGIWFIQPAVNRVIAKYAANNAQLE